MGSLLSRLSLFVTVTFAFPTAMILTSWNAFPGETLYPVKRGFEAVPRVAFGKTKTAADYEVLLADRRFIEATTLIKSHNTLGLSELNTSIALAKTKAEETQNTQAEDKLVNNLLAYNQKLEEEKTTLTLPTSPPAPPAVTVSPSITTPAPTLPPSPPRREPKPQSQETIKAIDDAQGKIKNTIEELKERKEKMRKGHQENKKQDKH